MDDPALTASASRLSRALADRYRIERELGRGGMATVFLAEDLKHGRPVAIKVLHPELGAWLGAERFLSEIRITARLQHPNILPLIDSGTVPAGSRDDERDGSALLYYVMPYVAGETARARLQRERQLPVGEAVSIAVDIASALSHAHAHGVIHRDIKPENILLGPPGGKAPALLADFGIARSLDATADRLTSTGLTVGTPAYMSPEQATAEREIDARSDIYSLGCVVYELLAGEPPFTGPNPRAILAKKLADPVRPISRLRDTIPPHVDRALATALGRSAADRFPDAASFAAALQGTDLAISGRHATLGSGGAAAPRRRRIIRGAAVAVGVLGAAAGAWAALSRPSVALGMPAVRVQRFTTPPGDTASAYLAATLQQDVIASLARSQSARVFVMDSARLPSGYAVSVIVKRDADSVDMKLSVTEEPSGEFKGQQVVRRHLGRMHQLPDLASDAILALVGRPRVTSASGRVPTTDSVAYDMFLKGRYLTDRRTEPATLRAVSLFRAAVDRDSTFAEGWAGLARALQQVTLRRYRVPGLPPDRVVATMIEASDRALELDSTRSYVWIARGLALRELEPSSRRNALLAYQRAIALDSTSADAWHYAALAWEDSLEPARALAAWRHTVRIDPTHRQALGFLGQHFNWMRQYDSAYAWADSGRRVDPSFLLTRQQLALASLYRGDTARAAENFRVSVRIANGPDEVAGWIGLAAIALQRRDRRAADTLFAHALAITDTVHPPVHDAAYVAWGYTAFGDTTTALRLLERFEPRADAHFQLHLHCDAGLDPLRRMPRFDGLLLRKVNVCPNATRRDSG